MSERTKRRSWMYTIFKRLYDLWYHKKDFPRSHWHAMNVSEVLGDDNQELIRAFSSLSLLEMEFC
jgi:hypothetical protein